MKLDWMLHPLICYALLAVAMSLCLYLFLAMQRQIQAAAARAGQENRKLKSDLLGLELELAQMRTRIEELGAAAAPAAMAPPAPGMNLNRRTQALRMARRGDRPDQIAAALQMPDSEVTLLLKIQRAVSELGSLKAIDAVAGVHVNNVAVESRAAAGA